MSSRHGRNSPQSAVVDGRSGHKYDDFWTDYTYYGDYANITNPPARMHPTYTKDPALNFPQQEDYALRILKR